MARRTGRQVPRLDIPVGPFRSEPTFLPFAFINSASPFSLSACAAIFGLGLVFCYAGRWPRPKPHPRSRRAHWLLSLYRGKSAALLLKILCSSESSPVAWHYLLPFICGIVTGFLRKVDLRQVGDLTHIALRRKQWDTAPKKPQPPSFKHHPPPRCAPRARPGRVPNTRGSYHVCAR